MAYGVPITAVDSQLADMAHSWLWCSFPWFWTKAALTAITLTNNIQDYANAHADYMRLVDVRIVQTNLSPIEYRSITPTSHLEPELTLKAGLNGFRMISREMPANVFRLDKAAQVTSPTVLQVQGEYQKRPTRITDALLTSATILGFHDEHIGTYIEFLVYYIYKLANDPRAGTVVINREGMKQYSGQLGVAYDALQRMLMVEDAGDASNFRFPDTPLGASRWSDPSGVFL